MATARAKGWQKPIRFAMLRAVQLQPPRKRYVAVAGTIGAGKTSLVSWLVDRYGLLPFYEPNDDNPYLADFYRDMSRWGFQSQIYFLSHKLELHQSLLAQGVPSVIDRTLYEDAEIFARNLHLQGHLDARDWAVYQRLYQTLCSVLPPPDVLIALSCSLPATKRRIRRRGRAMEADIPHSYLKRLHGLYEDWFGSYSLSPIVRIDTTDLDYVEDLLAMLELQERLDAVLGPPRASEPT